MQKKWDGTITLKKLLKMSKETAVEWLINRIEDVDLTEEMFEGIKKQAKEIEKEQHGKTWDCAIDNLDARSGNVVRAWADFDDYYNETYRSMI